MPKPKPLLIFVPGLGFRGEVYEPLLKHFRDRFEIRSADHPLELPKKIDWKFWDQVIDKAADGAKRFYLVGQSMGGPPALHYAATHPKRVIRTVAIAPVLWPFVRKPRTRRRKLLNILVAIRSGEIFHLLRLPRKYLGRSHPETTRRLAYWAGDVDLSDILGQLERSTVLWHRHEEVIPHKHFEKLQKEFSNITTVVIKGSHLSAVTEPRVIVPVMREALDG